MAAAAKRQGDDKLASPQAAAVIHEKWSINGLAIERLEPC